MAYQNHLDLLLKSSAEFDAWRRKNPDIVPDLTGADLIRADLTGITIDARFAKTLLPFKAISQEARDALVKRLDDLVV